MDYKEKYYTVKDLKSESHKEADRALLDKVAPRNSVTWRMNATDADILYLLVEYCTKEEILANRGTASSSGGKSAGNSADKKKLLLKNLFHKGEAKK